ncbi:hypothetical protein QQ045_022021 [Rhodiola kirilowii]
MAPYTRANTTEAMTALIASVVELTSRTERLEERQAAAEKRQAEAEVKSAANFERMIEMLEQLQKISQASEVHARKQHVHPNPPPTVTEPLLPTPPTPPKPNPPVNYNTTSTMEMQSAFFPRLPKLEVPMFTGDDVDGWTFKIDRYFEHHQVPEEHRVPMAGFYMSSEALRWYQWMHTTHQLSNWKAFIQDINSRFGQSIYWNAEICLNKLHQTTTVGAYVTEFESLSTRTPGFSTENLLNKFLAGL